MSVTLSDSSLYRTAVVVAMALCVVAGCASVGPLQEVDLEAPGWSVATGQALWKRSETGGSLAGELIVAQNENGDVLVSFSKPPVPVFTAQIQGSAWRLDLVDRGRVFSGRGAAPKRFIWFHLPELLNGGPPPKRWDVNRTADHEWLLSHHRRGESIRLVLDLANP